MKTLLPCSTSALNVKPRFLLLIEKVIIIYIYHIYIYIYIIYISLRRRRRRRSSGDWLLVPFDSYIFFNGVVCVCVLCVERGRQINIWSVQWGWCGKKKNKSDCYGVRSPISNAPTREELRCEWARPQWKNIYIYIFHRMAI